MNKISLVQVNFQQGPSNLASFYLPYSVGCIWSYANSFTSIQQNFSLEHVIWQRDSVQHTADKLQYQDVVGFSCYIWNRNYNFVLAREIKKRNPHCFIFFGGPEPAHTDPDFFRKHPYVDAVVIQEGELTVKNLLENLERPGSVPGLIYNQGGTSINTGQAERIQDLAMLPSPYLTGFFDSILRNAPEVQEWAATLETNRGCPYQCTFCDWGSLTYNKVKQFPLDKVFAEIEWMAINRIHYMSIADANFGMFVDRDSQIIDKYIEMQQQFGFPESYTASYAKNQKKEVLNIVEKSIKNSSKFNVGLNISLQTLDDDVLTVIKRKNLNQQHYEDILREGTKRNIVVGTELILGLPGDNITSWKKNYWHLLETGLHENIDFWVCQLLENSEMNLVQKKIYGIQTAAIYDYLSPNIMESESPECWENIEVCIGHDSMPHDDWLDCYVFSWFMNTFHMGGTSEYFSRFLRAYASVSYESFYTDLYTFLIKDVWFQEQEQELRESLEYWIRHGRIEKSIAGVKIGAYNLPWITLMKIHADTNAKTYIFDQLSAFLRRYALEEPLQADLERLQHHRLMDMQDRSSYPRKQCFGFNLLDCMIHNQALAEQPNQLEFRFPEKSHMSDSEFLERLYFGRRRRFGKTWIYQI